MSAIVAYTVLVGVGPSVVRAAIVGDLALTAQQIGRRSQGLNALALAAWGMTVYNPQWLWDVGLQPSAGATLGLVLYAKPLQNGVKAQSIWTGWPAAPPKVRTDRKDIRWLPAGLPLAQRR